ncbi:MAG: DUF2971 domain-containing protein [Bacteroidales bacterium]
MTDLLVFQSTPFMSEFETRKDFLKKTPIILYKYRPFDRYAFEMIEEGYAYLAPVKGLDDPFDCLNDFTINDFYNEKTHKITPKAVDFIIKLVCPKGIQNLSPKEVKKLALQCTKEDGIDYEKVPKVVTSNGIMTRTEVEPLFVVLNTFNENFEGVIESAKLDGFAKSAMSPGDRVGICSLSEKRDNKVMWSLYGNNYEGYCIEYDIPKRQEVTPNLCPVIYTKRNNNRFIEKMIEDAIGAFMRAVTDGHLTGNIGASMELFCTKDTDWSYQAEWRLIANAGGRFRYLNIKAVYLGFKVKKSNESKMKKLAKEKGFSLFKMNQLSGKKRITYSKII